MYRIIYKMLRSGDDGMADIFMKEICFEEDEMETTAFVL